MNSFENQFGEPKPESTKPSEEKTSTLTSFPPAKALPARNSPVDLAKDESLIRSFDYRGREMLMTREAWRTTALPGLLKSNWNDRDQLFDLILKALDNGFCSDVIAAAEWLGKIDRRPQRVGCIRGGFLIEEGRLAEAEQILRYFLGGFGMDGFIFASLAKIYARQNDDAKAEENLWKALEADPNQEHALAWYGAIHRERGGEAGWLGAMHRVAALSGSWLAQVWFARIALQSRQQEQAFACYRQGLAHVARPAPTNLLMQMSCDLLNAGHLPELLQLTKPYFLPEIHGLRVGNHLIKAHVDLAQFEAARRIMDQLYALKRFQWQIALRTLETEIAEAGLATLTLDRKQPMATTILTFEGPIWLPSGSPAAELFPAKASDGLSVCFLAGTVERASDPQRFEYQLSDEEARMSRALPSFFAEQIEFHTHTRVRLHVTHLTQEIRSFVLQRLPWIDENAAAQARVDFVQNDYVVTTHLKTRAKPWTMELRLVRTIDGKCLGQLNGAFPSHSPQDTVPRIAQQLVSLLADQAGVETRTPPLFYQVPVGTNFAGYLVRLEYLLGARCAVWDKDRPIFVGGERMIIDNNILQCLLCPQNVPSRLVLAESLSAVKKTRPEILPEFKDKLAIVQNEKPLPEPAHSVLQRMFNEVLLA
jgi:tetratricopeptide (TPR) repeat protein